jgi:uncharacterized protein (DUF924 family)
VLTGDQLPRNLFRGTQKAFAFDNLAHAAARTAVDKGWHRQLASDERAFLYLPFEHSERRSDQHLSVGLFTELRDATPPGRRHLTGAYLRHAHQHRDLIERFGRFPHRNEALGRAASDAELDYLRSASGFGQQADA